MPHVMMMTIRRGGATAGSVRSYAAAAAALPRAMLTTTSLLLLLLAQASTSQAQEGQQQQQQLVRCSEHMHNSSKATWELPPSSGAAVGSHQPGYRHYFKQDFEGGGAWAQPPDLDPYLWFTPQDDRQAGLHIRGDPSRMRAALHRHLVEGGNLTVVFVGGSITLGSSPDGLSFPQWFELILRKTEPFRSAATEGRLSVVNAGAPGTSSSYMALCHRLRLPRNLDIVFVDYAKNDAEGVRGDFAQNPLRRTFERLLRKLLQYPNTPAVAMIQAFPWSSYHELSWSVERELDEFAGYYRLAAASVKAAAYHLMEAGVPGFIPQGFRRRDDGVLNNSLLGQVFYLDGGGHPDPHTGYRLMGELAAQMVLDAAAGLPVAPLTEHDRSRCNRTLPPPMIYGNYESSSERCLVEGLFHSVVESSTDWVWTDEGRSKWGFVSSTVGSVLSLVFDSSLPDSNAHADHASLRVAYLKSYEHMGSVKVQCISGCTCETQTFSTYEPKEHHSLMKMHRLAVTQSTSCRLTLEVAPETTSDGHKVKILGILVSEDPLERAKAHEWTDIHDASDMQLHKNGLYVGRR